MFASHSNHYRNNLHPLNLLCGIKPKCELEDQEVFQASLVLATLCSAALATFFGVLLTPFSYDHSKVDLVLPLALALVFGGFALWLRHFPPARSPMVALPIVAISFTIGVITAHLTALPIVFGTVMTLAVASPIIFVTPTKLGWGMLGFVSAFSAGLNSALNYAGYDFTSIKTDTLTVMVICSVAFPLSFYLWRYWLKSGEEVTSLKRMQKTAQEMEEIESNISFLKKGDESDTALVGTFMLTPSGNVIYASNSALELLKITKDDLTGQGIEEFIEVADRAKYFAQLYRLKTENKTGSFEFSRIQSTPVKGEHGKCEPEVFKLTLSIIPPSVMPDSQETVLIGMLGKVARAESSILQITGNEKVYETQSVKSMMRTLAERLDVENGDEFLRDQGMEIMHQAQSESETAKPSNNVSSRLNEEEACNVIEGVNLSINNIHSNMQMISK